MNAMRRSRVLICRSEQSPLEDLLVEESVEMIGLAVGELLTRAGPQALLYSRPPLTCEARRKWPHGEHLLSLLNQVLSDAVPCLQVRKRIRIIYNY